LRLVLDQATDVIIEELHGRRKPVVNNSRDTRGCNAMSVCALPGHTAAQAERSAAT
jgi:hypothetical protein